jgi:plastocyanin
MANLTVRKGLAVALAAGALLAFPGVSESATSTIKAMGTAPGNFHWMPTPKSIHKGDTIVWKNTTSTTHHVVGYKGSWNKNSSIAANGGTTSFHFTKRGTYKYRCDIPGHSTLASDGTCSGMCGVIHVKP